MTKPKGGRGKKAPYETTHVRVPIPIKPQIERMLEIFYEGGAVQPEQPLPLSDALPIAQQVLRQKKSAKTSIEKLLTAIYQTEITL